VVVVVVVVEVVVVLVVVVVVVVVLVVVEVVVVDVVIVVVVVVLAFREIGKFITLFLNYVNLTFSFEAGEFVLLLDVGIFLCHQITAAFVWTELVRFGNCLETQRSFISVQTSRN